MHIALVKELAANRFSGPTLEQDIVGDHDRGTTGYFHQGFDVLEEIELFVEVWPGTGRMTSTMARIRHAA